MADESNSWESGSVGKREFVTLLISLYRDYPELWNVKSIDYLNKNKRSTALQNMVNVLKQFKPDYTEEKLKQKINILRTNFNKEITKIEKMKQSGASVDDIPEPTLWYYNDLLFIREQVDQITETDRLKPAPQQGETVSDVHSGPPHQKRKKRAQNDTADHLVCLAAACFKKLESEPVVLAKGWSLKLNRLPPDQRRYAEKIINDTLFEAEMGTLTRHGVHFLTEPQSTSTASAPAQDPPAVENELLPQLCVSSQYQSSLSLSQIQGHIVTSLPQENQPEFELETVLKVENENY